MVWIWLERIGLVGAVVLPLVAAAWARLRPAATGYTGLSWAAFGSALAAVAAVAVRGPATLSVGAGPGLVADPVSVLLLALVVGVGATVQSFSTRYLQADPGYHRFAARVGLVVTAVAVVAVSGDLVGLVLAWVAAGAGFAALLSYRSDLPGVAGSVRALRWGLAVGDACLVAAAAVVVACVGDVHLGSPGRLEAAAGHLGPWHPVVAVLLTVAALARCAQGVFRRWLPLTVSAPTPACALLHAGVVNGGGVLLVRLGALGSWGPAMTGLFIVAGATAVWAGLVAGRQADVKGQLAFSTMSQMGFMLAECAVGAYPAALVHLVGHGCYKMSLFFSSGSAVPRPGRPPAPVRTRRPSLRMALVGAAAAAAAAPGVAAGDGTVLAVLAALTAASLAAAVPSGVRGGPGRGGAVWTALLVAAAGGYGTVVAGLARLLGGGPVVSSGGVNQWWLTGIAAAAVIGARLASAGRLAPAVHGWLVDAGTAPPGWDRVRSGRRHRYDEPVWVAGEPQLQASAA